MIVFCKNLSAHVVKEAKEVFHKGNVLLCVCPAQINESS